MTLTTNKVLIDFANDGDFYGTGEDVTARSLARSTVRFTRGLDGSRIGAPPMAGELNGLELDNRTKDYSAFYSSSPIYGLVVPGRRLEWRTAIAKDSFDRANSASAVGTPDLGAAWTALDGTWGITSNRAYQVSAGTGKPAVVIPVDLADVAVECTLAVLGFGVMRVVFRAVDKNNLWFVSAGTAGLFLEGYSAGALFTLGTWLGTVSAGDVVRVEAVQSSIKIFLNGDHKFTVTDTFNQTATMHGIGSDGSAATANGRWDDFTVYVPQWNGLVRSFRQNPNPLQKSVSVTALGMLSRLAKTKGQSIYTTLYQDITTDVALGYLLDACGLTDTNYRRFDTGRVTLRWWWLDPDEDPFEAALQIVRTEGGLLYEDGVGRLVFKNWQSADVDSRRYASQRTLSDTTASEPAWSDLFELEEGHSEIINAAGFTHKKRALAAAVAKVWELGSVLTLVAYETASLLVNTTDPFSAAVNPTVTTDYVVTAGSLSATPVLSQTSGSATKITMTAGSSGATIAGPASATTGIQLRAKTCAVSDQRPVAESISTTTSRTAYATSVYPYAVRSEADFNVLQDRADEIVTVRQQPLAVARYQVKNANPTRLTEMLTREVGDRVTLKETQTGLSAGMDFYVTQIEHEIALGGGVHVATFGAERAWDTPLAIPHLELWHDYNTLASLGDATAISAITDSSRQGNSGAQTGTNRPIVKLAQSNGRAVGRFDGSNDSMVVPDAARLDNVSGMTWFIVLKPIVLATAKTILAKWDYQTDGAWAIRIDQTTNTELQIFVANAANDGGGNLATTTGLGLSSSVFQILEIVYEGTNATNGSRVSFARNGTVISSSVSGTIPTSMLNAAATVKTGVWGGTITNYINADFAEILMFSDDLSTTFRNRVRQFLGHRHNLSVTLT